VATPWWTTVAGPLYADRMADKVITGVAAAAGSFIGLVLGSAAGQLFSRTAHSPDTRTATLVLGGMTGMLGGAFTGAALAAYEPPGTPGTVAGLPRGVGKTPSGLGAAPHKCTIASATKIAQQIPGAPWVYAGSITGVANMTEARATVVTPQGTKTIPYWYDNVLPDGITRNRGLMPMRLVIQCPHSGELFRFQRPVS
jgi:hypothetical protein